MRAVGVEEEVHAVGEGGVRELGEIWVEEVSPFRELVEFIVWGRTRLESTDQRRYRVALIWVKLVVDGGYTVTILDVFLLVEVDLVLEEHRLLVYLDVLSDVETE